jgi:hypothetical protein
MSILQVLVCVAVQSIISACFLFYIFNLWAVLYIYAATPIAFLIDALVFLPIDLLLTRLKMPWGIVIIIPLAAANIYYFVVPLVRNPLIQQEAPPQEIDFILGWAAAWIVGRLASVLVRH